MILLQRKIPEHIYLSNLRGVNVSYMGRLHDVFSHVAIFLNYNSDEFICVLPHSLNRALLIFPLYFHSSMTFTC